MEGEEKRRDEVQGVARGEREGEKGGSAGEQSHGHERRRRTSSWSYHSS